jgi:xanthine dehydrogenase accessory protein XdhC
MSETLAEIARDLLARDCPCVLITVARASGSTPREVGAGMLVTAEKIFGTIGGGQLEWRAMIRARSMLAVGEDSAILDLPLGPSIGQCCGGRMALELARLDAAVVERMSADAAALEESQPMVMIFGAGHVGRAVAAASAPLPVQSILVDGRPEWLENAPAGTRALPSTDPVRTLVSARHVDAVLVMTHSHALDFEITGAALARPDLPYVGLIGSVTKRRRFERWYQNSGGPAADLARLVCPIGGGEVADKRAPVIAALVAAELVTRLLDNKVVDKRARTVEAWQEVSGGEAHGGHTVAADA